MPLSWDVEFSTLRKEKAHGAFMSSSNQVKVWIVCGLLLLATMINYMDRLTLNQTSDDIMKAFDFKKDFYGKVEGVFGLAFAVGAITTGMIVDKISVRLLYPLMVFFWSLSGFLTGLARDKEELIWCRAALGFFEAANWPCALVTTQRILDSSKRTMGNSVLQSGAALGAVITPIIIEMCLRLKFPEGFSHLEGWRSSFLIIGLTGLLWIVFWFIFTKDVDLSPQETQKEQNSSSTWNDLSDIVKNRNFWILMLTVLSINMTWHFFRAWLPLYLKETHGYTKSQVNWFSSGYYLASDIGSLFAGFLTLRLAAKGFKVFEAKKIVFGTFSVITLLSILVAFMPAGPLFLGLLMVLGFATLALFPCYYSFSQTLTKKHQGKVTGFLGSFTWTGMFIMQIGAGLWIQGTENHYTQLYLGQGMLQEAAESLAKTKSYTLGIALAGIPPIISFLAIHLFWNPKGSIEQESH